MCLHSNILVNMHAAAVYAQVNLTEIIDDIYAREREREFMIKKSAQQLST